MKPLTIEELKALQVGDWVWFTHNRVKPCYGIIIAKHDDTIYFNTTEGLQRVHWKNYDNTWTVYKNKEQAETKGEWVGLPCKIGDTVYVVYKDKWEYSIYAASATGFYIDERGVEIITDFACYPCDRIGNFTDKAQAEARLKELRGEK